jgi:Domain of unknown function (DUF1816)
MTLPIDSNYEALRLSWWIEVFTAHPLCIYYFGPFETEREAQLAQEGHLEDLRAEGSDIISMRTSFSQPRRLTIYEDELTIHGLDLVPLFSTGSIQCDRFSQT